MLPFTSAGECIRDPNGWRINGPYLEAFSDPGQLRRALSGLPVPLNGLTAAGAATAKIGPTPNRP
jgi:hypothetical protein